MRYRFNRVKTVEDILKAIGREDIPSKDVRIIVPSINPETGEYLADFEIDFGPHELTSVAEAKLKGLMRGLGYVFKEKV